jgi:hypothetical protein
MNKKELEVVTNAIVGLYISLKIRHTDDEVSYLD